MAKYNNRRRISAQRGIVIVENMVALLIFSIGVLGIVGLLAVSIKDVGAAKYRNEASLLASQLIGQMWADDKSNDALKKNYASPDGTQFSAWGAQVTKTLPGAASYPPTVTVGDDNMVTITVKWKEPGEAATHNFTTTTRISG